MTAANDTAVLAEQAAHEQKVLNESGPFDIVFASAGPEVAVIRDMARAMELAGDTPAITWIRDEHGEIAGVKLTGHMSRESANVSR